MIIKFDHISYVAERSPVNGILKECGEPVFSEEGLRNPTVKNALMRYPQQDHDLYFFDKDIPVEYILYDKIGEPGDIRVIDDRIHGKYTDIHKAAGFLESLFGKRSVNINGDQIECNMKGVIDRRDYILVLSRSEKDDITPFLDDGGYGIPALIVNKDINDIVNGTCTEREHLEVNGKDLVLCFARSMYTNVIIEMIKVSR